jgi:ABC-type phosphate/phosphonate transport system substrate-binding protein
VEAPVRLSRPSDLPGDWLRPDLLLSQTCGLPFVRHLRGRVALVAGVAYDLPDCAPGTYRSRLVVRSHDDVQSVADLRGRVAAINAEGSQSGAGALRATVGPLREGGRFFGRVVETGAHAESIGAVARGEADVAAIDAVTFALAQRHLPEARSVRVLASTSETPGLPLVTRRGGPARALFEAIGEAIEAIGAEARSALLLRGIVPRREEDFDGIAAADAAIVLL